ncbi:MAG: hypothetical protein Q9167_001859 [Letrouitia subvulpina]
MIKYSSLDRSNQEIRLVRLKSKNFVPTKPPSAQSNDVVPLYCELFHCRLGVGPPYNALSYHWGDSDDKRDIHVNGARTEVTRNLRVALEHLQESKSDVMLWIDALCINQTDKEEKDHEIKRMREIYGMSASTISWLGPADIDSDLVMAKIRKIGAHIESHDARGLFYKLVETPNSAESAEYDATNEEISTLMSTFLDSALREFFPVAAFDRLLLRPYWERVWIFQEIIVSPRVEVMCGYEKFPFEYFHNAMLFVPLLRMHVTKILGHELLARIEHEDGDTEMYNHVMEMSQSPHLAASRTCGMRRRFQEHSNTPYETLFRLLAKVHVGSVTHATLPKDRIWALLRMATDATSFGPVLDYTDSTRTVYTKVARAVIEAGQIDLLSLCQFPKSSVVENLPSWVPDWCAALQEPSGQLPWDTAFHASGPSSFQPRSNNTTLTPTQLKLKGCRIDIVEAVRPEWTPGPDGCTRDTGPVTYYLIDIMILCTQSNEKARESGVEIYSDPKTERELAPFRIPIADQEHDTIGFTRSSTVKSSKGYHEVLKNVRSMLSLRPQDKPPQSDEMQSYYNMMGRLRFRRPFISTKGYVGLGPVPTQVGDVIVTFLGAKFPYILRKSDSGDGTYTLVGETYVQGVMYGEFMRIGPETEWFVLN